jgi:predicted negative regulator of RcsB-dependent stress response
LWGDGELSSGRKQESSPDVKGVFGEGASVVALPPAPPSAAVTGRADAVANLFGGDPRSAAPLLAKEVENDNEAQLFKRSAANNLGLWTDAKADPENPGPRAKGPGVAGLPKAVIGGVTLSQVVKSGPPRAAVEAMFRAARSAPPPRAAMEALFHAIKSAPPPPAASQAPVRGGTRSIEPEDAPAVLELDVAVEPSEARSLPAAPRSLPAPRRVASPAPRRASLPSPHVSEAPPQQAANSEFPARDKSRVSKPLVAEPAPRQRAGLGSVLLPACTFLLVCIAVLLGGAYTKLWPLPPSAAAMLHLDRSVNPADQGPRMAARTPPTAAQQAPSAPSAPPAPAAPTEMQPPALAPNAAEPQAPDAPTAIQRPALAPNAMQRPALAPNAVDPQAPSAAQPAALAAKAAEPQTPDVPSAATRPAVLAASAAAPQRAAAATPQRPGAPDEPAQPTAAQVHSANGSTATPAAAGAQPVTEHASPLPPSSPATNLSGEKLLQVTRQKARANDLAGAEALARAAIANDPDDHHAMEALVEVLIEESKGAEAVKYAVQIVRKRPKRASYRLLEGDARLLANDRTGAERAWREALALEPQNRDAKRRLGLAR